MARSFWVGPAPVGLLVMFASSIARAEPSEPELAAAREMFNEARVAEDAGRWEEALSKLESVARVKMTPQVRFHLGLCEENVGRLVEALNHFERARAEAAEKGLPTVVAEAKRHAADVRARTAKVTIVLPAGHADARVEIDGEAIASVLLSRPLLLDPGKHVVRSSAPGLGFEREIVLEPRETARLAIELSTIAARPSEGANAAPLGGEAASPHQRGAGAFLKVAAGPAQARPDAAGHGAASTAVAGWWLVGGGALAAAGAVAAAVVRSTAVARIDDVCPSHEGCPRELEDTYERARASRALAISLGALGGAAVSTGVILLLTSGPRSARAGVVLHPWLTAQGGGTTAAIAW